VNLLKDYAGGTRLIDTTDISLTERLEFERLLADLSVTFANLPSDRVIEETEQALLRLIEFLDFDRSSLGELPPNGERFEVLCSVSRNGVEPTPRGPTPRLPWYFGELRAGRTVVFSTPADLPAEAVAEAEYCRRSGLRSNLAIPLRVGGRVVGALALTAFRRTRTWPEELIARLTIVGEVFAHAIARSRRDAELAAALAEIKQLKERLEAENIYLRKATHASLRHTVASRSPCFNVVLDEIAQVAPTGSTVLLLGETGTGKELLARAIHNQSGRKHLPMVTINCAALPASLIEAELFGREKGAYTGALARQMGRFEIADGSTILLDEVGELPLELQPKLLRVLQDGGFERVGSTRTITVDVRMIAATNRDLSRAVGEGTFREDLYYRLNVFPVVVPPLRERCEDIPLLAWEFVTEFSESMGKPIEHIADDSMKALQAYPWPGNVRELRNVIERAMILARGTTLHVSLGRTPMPAPGKAPVGTLEASERAHILRALKQTGWRIRGSGGAAELLDIKPTTLDSRVKKLGIRRSDSDNS
jgi:transcriptional regulator with GAF, ATPase, and Fis domain